jgi:hypothetical protein
MAWIERQTKHLQPGSAKGRCLATSGDLKNIIDKHGNRYAIISCSRLKGHEGQHIAYPGHNETMTALHSWES